MTDQQRHQAITRVIKATNDLIIKSKDQLDLIEAHVDLIMNLNTTEVDLPAIRAQVKHLNTFSKRKLKI